MITNLQKQIISGLENPIELRTALFNQDRYFYLNRIALATLLERCVAGDISCDALRGLSEALEMNEWVNVDEPADVVINDVLFELANPDINGAMTRPKLAGLIEVLSSSK